MFILEVAGKQWRMIEECEGIILLELILSFIASFSIFSASLYENIYKSGF
jgi:hypothetical protein